MAVGEGPARVGDSVAGWEGPHKPEGYEKAVRH
jgi:hypothetical protein